MTPEQFFGTFIKKLRLAKADFIAPSDSAEPSVTEWATEADANLVTSRLKDPTFFAESHVLVLDLDVEHLYVPSTNAGHGHLIVNVPLTEKEWEATMTQLAKVGVIQAGYLRHSLARGFASLRLPWVKKAA